MLRLLSVLYLLPLLLFVASCGGERGGEKGGENSVKGEIKKYTPPAPPAILGSDREKVLYLVDNYWANYNFCDTTVALSDVTEEAFAQYLYLFPATPIEKAQSAMGRLMSAASQDSVVFDRFFALSEKYLYDPNSIYRNEELYIPVLRYFIRSSVVDEWCKVRPQHQLDMALKNRVGAKATDFVITEKSGRTIKLSQIDSDNIVLFFNNPDCPDCARVKEYIMKNEVVFSKTKIVSVYTESDVALWKKTEYPEVWINGYDKDLVIEEQELYDLKAIPTVYLLNGNKEVVLKDSSIELIAKYIGSRY